MDKQDILLDALTSAKGTDAEKGDLYNALLKAWSIRSQMVLINRLNKDEVVEVEQRLVMEPSFNFISWILGIHPEYESVVMNELDAVMSDFADELGVPHKE